MDLGFDTVGNGTLIAYDAGPKLVTDPWIEGAAYFGSWRLSHEIPTEQVAAIRAAPFVWVSHGHPDHLQWESIQSLRGKTILLPDHVGSRIAEALRSDGHTVQILPDRRWTVLSERIRVFCFTDAMQDAGLLVELGSSMLLVNINDLSESGWMPSVRRIARRYPTSVVLAASGFGDIRGMNHWDANGARLPSFAQVRKEAGVKVGVENAALTSAAGGTHFVPFSSMHQYQRRDSSWANEYLTDLDDFIDGYSSRSSVALPAYIRWEVGRDPIELKPAAIEVVELSERAFGDDWSETLTPEEVGRVVAYFRETPSLGDHLSFVTIRVGGEEHGVRYSAGDGGVSFHVPRSSLLSAVDWHIWEDLILGNFMRTTFHGLTVDAGMSAVCTYVARYADQADARTRREVADYLALYRQRMGRAALLRHRVERTIISHSRRVGAEPSALYRIGRSVYNSATRR